MRATEAFEAILAFGEHEHRDLPVDSTASTWPAAA